jgi:prophage regulatory protein
MEIIAKRKSRINVTPSSLIVRPKDIPSVVGLGRTTVFRLEKKGEFPKRRRISDSCVGWLRSELDEWLKSREAV